MVTQLLQLASNATVAKVINADREVKLIVSDLLSYAVEGAEFSQAFKSGGWDGRSSFFDYRQGTFPAGFAPMVGAELIKRGYRVQTVKRRLPEAQGPENPIVDEFGNDDPRYDYQMETVRQLLKRGMMIARVATGGGKCLGRDTPVLMYDGSVKSVQDVVVGDLLMGPDSQPRTVLSTVADWGKLYRVTPAKGDSYVVNDAHILSLKQTNIHGRAKGGIVNINVEKYLAETKWFRHTHKGWRTGVEFPAGVTLPVEPYFVGLLLGDGSIGSTVSLTTADPEIVAEIERQAAIWDLNVRSYGKTQSKNEAKTYQMTAGMRGGLLNPLMGALRGLGLGLGEKFVPQAYKTASRIDRLAVLAGIIDTDGYYDGKCLYVTLKCERLLDDVVFLARSLGFAAYKKAVKKTCCNNGKEGDYFATVISGDLDQVPVRLERRKPNPRAQKKDHLVTGLTVEAIGEGEYFGFEIDGDSLFMLGDFTVTHNTKIAKLCTARIKRPTLFITTRGVLMYQMKAGFEDAGFTVGVMGDSEWSPRRGVNVAMIQTLIARLEDKPLESFVEAIVAAQFNAETRQIEELKTSMAASSILPGIQAKRIMALTEKLEKARLGDAQIAKLATEKHRAHHHRRASTIKIMEMFEFVIGEEAHEAGGNSYFEVLRHCRNAVYRLALTATPFMKADAESNMRLMAAFGPIGIEISEKRLIDSGILARPYFKFVEVPPPKLLKKSTPWQRAYKIGIVENEGRNRAIVFEAHRAAQLGLPVMVLVQHKAHGKILKELLEKAGVRTDFIFGESDQAKRQATLNALRDGKIQCLIGSTILDVGVDVPAVGMVILAGGGKAEVALRQRIGRGLRAKRSGPNIAFVVDFSDSTNAHLRDHARERNSIITSTPGFQEQVLKPGEDFNFAALGFRAAA